MLQFYRFTIIIQSNTEANREEIDEAIDPVIVNKTMLLVVALIANNTIIKTIMKKKILDKITILPKEEDKHMEGIKIINKKRNIMMVINNKNITKKRIKEEEEAINNGGKEDIEGIKDNLDIKDNNINTQKMKSIMKKTNNNNGMKLIQSKDNQNKNKLL